MALHRLSRLLTYSLCGEAYLTFMGNEFGHPEWIDLPREGNGHSLERARRRWDLADDPKLRYGQLYDFEVAMHRVHDSHPWLDAPAPTSRGDGTIGCCEQKQCLWFVRGSCWFGFNLHTTQATTLLWPVVHKGRSRCPPWRYRGDNKCSCSSMLLVWTTTPDPNIPSCQGPLPS